jgi:hypothetical protein
LGHESVGGGADGLVAQRPQEASMRRPSLSRADVAAVTVLEEP